MALTDAQLSHLDELLSQSREGSGILGEIRACLPEITVSRCQAGDMAGETPYRSIGAFDVFLIDNLNHCWRIVDDPAAAGAIVIAARS